MLRFRAAAALAAAILALAPAACRRAAPADATVSASPAPAAAPAQPLEDARPKSVAFGDSLTAGLGLLEAQAYPSLLQNEIDRDGSCASLRTPRDVQAEDTARRDDG